MVMVFRACFFGLGSIGMRHLRNLYVISCEMNIDLRVDALRTRKGTPEEKTQQIPTLKEYDRESDLAERYDVAFITNPTYLHYETLKKILPIADHIYIEKPLFESFRRNFRDIPWRNGHVYHVACPLRRDPCVQYLASIGKRPLSVRIVCSSYLPDWRPGTNYSTSYSASDEEGGGVWRDLVHEWDYVRFLWGDPIRVSSFRKKVSALNIHSDDIAAYLADFGDFVAEIHLDYFGRSPRRVAEVFFDDDILQADMLKRQMRYLYSGKTVPLTKSDNHYEDLKYFLNTVLAGGHSDNPPEFAWNTLRCSEEDMR